MELDRNHNYGEIDIRKGVQRTWTESMAYGVYPYLLKYEADPHLLSRYREGIDQSWKHRSEEASPFICFTHKSLVPESDGDVQGRKRMRKRRTNPLFSLGNVTLHSKRRWFPEMEPDWGVIEYLGVGFLPRTSERRPP